MIYTIFKHVHTDAIIIIFNNAENYSSLVVDKEYSAVYAGADFQCASELKKLYLQE